MENISCIYRIQNVINNKGYVGSAMSKEARWREHHTQLRNNKHHSILLQRAWNKYGEDQFVFEVIEILDNPTKKMLLEREQYWIDFYDAANPDKGYNILSKAGSRQGVKASEETKEKLRISHLGHKPSKAAIEACRQAMLGKKKSKEAIAKSVLARTVPLETRICLCGCNETFQVKLWDKKQFLNRDHSDKGRHKLREIRICICGCAESFEVIVTSPKRLIYHHMPSGRPSPRKGQKATKETIEKLRISHLGKKQTQETIDKRMKNMRGKIIVPREVRICKCGCNGTFSIRKTLPYKYLPGHYLQFLKRSK